jgi:F-type H+-transporting ATPase subunit delta
MKAPAQAAARRYARALVDVAAAANVAEGLRAELAEAAALLADNPELGRALAHPAVPVEKRRRLIVAVWERRGSSPLLVRLLTLLAERGRMGLLPAIEQAYGEVWNARRGVVSARAVSAVALDKGQRDTLEAALTKARRREVELVAKTDPSVIGGLAVTMEGRTYDGSVRGRLQALKQRLTGAAHG